MNWKQLASAALCGVTVLVSAGTVPAATSAEVTAVKRAGLPAKPDDAAWKDAPLFTTALLLQDMVEPRLMQASTANVEVRAVTDGSRVAFRIDWADATKDDLPGIARYSDACAVQLPVSSGPDVPAPQMGEAQRPVEISYWRAFWQSTVDGREDSIKALYPGATVDHYPFEAAALKEGSDTQREMAKRYAPARALGNDLAGPRDRPVQDLVAEGPGTIRPAEKPQSNGAGAYSGKGWSVVISRPLPKGLESGARTQVAFAVWEGGHQESGARKMRSAWIPLLIEK